MKDKLFYIILALIFLFPNFVSAQTAEFTYQGRLNDSAGTAANYDLQFRLCRSASNCATLNLLGTRERLGVPVSKGLFIDTLDFAATSFNGTARFLEIGVKTAGSTVAYTILAPRQRITSSPYSIKSLTVETATPATPTLPETATHLSERERQAWRVSKTRRLSARVPWRQ